MTKVYCSVCFKEVEIPYVGSLALINKFIYCPCEQQESVAVRKIFNNTNDQYGLFEIDDMVPSTFIIQEILKAQGKSDY